MSEQFKRPAWDEYFMLQAELAKLRSNCITRQVGAVIARDHRQLSTGYNGTPPGIKNCYEGGCKRCADRMEGKIKSGEALDRCVCNHAEANAIMKVAASTQSSQGATLYITLSPCKECSKLIFQSGIKRVVYHQEYKDNEGLKFLKKAGLEITHYKSLKI